MKSKKLVLFIGLFVLLLGFCGEVQKVLASDGAGGQVTVQGGITFYEDSSEPVASSSSSTSESSSNELPSTGGGKLPQTGEMVRNFSFIGGVVILAVLLLFLYRRKKDKDKEEEGQS
ncbi:LPXTG cell wall anchor domain-containing protein [Enterococcus sp. LJL90]